MGLILRGVAVLATQNPVSLGIIAVAGVAIYAISSCNETEIEVDGGGVKIRTKK